jgi:hypothetical protein
MSKEAPMITDSNHACFAKMAACGFQEELIYLICQNVLGRGKEKGRIEQRRCRKR